LQNSNISHSNHLDVLFAHLQIRPCGPASTTHLYTKFLCLIDYPLGLEEPLPGIPVAARTAECWLDSMSLTARFLRCVPPSSPVHACYTPRSFEFATNMDSLACYQASVLLGSPFAPQRLLSPSHPPCRSPQASCMFTASDPVSDD
jgi:hypothetical protein